MILSILTVTLNARAHLPSLAASIRAQGHFDQVEWVVVDGASTDGTVDLLKQEVDIVTRWISEPDCGFYDALNKAVNLARGDFYLVMGADDTFHENAFKTILDELATNPGGDLVCFSVLRGGRIRRGKPATPLRRAIGWASFISSHSVGTAIRRSLHDTLGKYSLRYPLLSDGHFMMKSILRGDRLQLRDACVGEFANGGLTSTDVIRLIAETWMIQIHLGANSFVQTLLMLARTGRYWLVRGAR